MPYVNALEVSSLKSIFINSKYTTQLVQSRKLSWKPWSKNGKIKPQVSGESSGWTQFLVSLFLFAVGVFVWEVWREEKAREKSSLAAYMTGGKGWRGGSVLAMTSQASSWLTLLLTLYTTDSSEGMCCSTASLLLATGISQTQPQTWGYSKASGQDWPGAELQSNDP